MATEKYPEEFEIIPISPIRRLEKRIEQLESMGGIDSRQILRDIISIVRMNQQLVDELAKANDALRIEISKLPARLEELINSLNELLSYIKASAEEEVKPASQISLKPLTDKIEKLIEQNQKMIETNKSVLLTLSEISEKLKKPSVPLRKPVLRKPI